MLSFSLGEKIGLAGSTLYQWWMKVLLSSILVSIDIADVAALILFRYSLDLARCFHDFAVLALCRSSLFGWHLLLSFKILPDLPQ